MIWHILFLIIVALAISCNSGRQETPTEISANGSEKEEHRVKDSIRFEFNASQINNIHEPIKINAILFNDNADTAYFLSSTCDGEQYSLRYDTVKFELTAFIDCNGSSPKIIAIAPKGQHEFHAHFRCRTEESQIKLGFDFYSVEKSFNLTNKNLDNINIFNRSKDLQTILWAIEKPIK